MASSTTCGEPWIKILPVPVNFLKPPGGASRHPTKEDPARSGTDPANTRLVKKESEDYNDRRQDDVSEGECPSAASID